MQTTILIMLLVGPSSPSRPARERVRGGSLQSSWSHAGYSAQDAKHLHRLEAAFPLVDPPQLSVKAFCKLFKSADIANQ